MRRRIHGRKGQDFTWGTVVYIVLGIIIIFIGFTLLPKFFGTLSKSTKCPGSCRSQCDSSENTQGFCSDQDVGGIVQGKGALTICCVPKLMNPDGSNPATGSARPTPLSEGTFTLKSIEHISTADCTSGTDPTKYEGKYCGDEDESRPKLLMTKICHKWGKDASPTCGPTCDYCAQVESVDTNICAGLVNSHRSEYSCKTFPAVVSGSAKQTCVGVGTSYCIPGYCPQETAYCQRDLPYNLIVQIGGYSPAQNQVDALGDIGSLPPAEISGSRGPISTGQLYGPIDAKWGVPVHINSIRIEGTGVDPARMTCVALLWRPSVSRLLSIDPTVNAPGGGIYTLTYANSYAKYGACSSFGGGLDVGLVVGKELEPYAKDLELHVGVVDPDKCKGLTGEQATFDCVRNMDNWRRNSRWALSYASVPTCPSSCEQIAPILSRVEPAATLQQVCTDTTKITSNCALTCSFVDKSVTTDGKDACVTCPTTAATASTFCQLFSEAGCETHGGACTLPAPGFCFVDFQNYRTCQYKAS